MDPTRNLRKVLPVLALITVTAGCRLDMHIQPYYRPMAKSEFFGDGRSARMPVEGTVPRGDLREDAYFYTGKIGNNTGYFIPFPVPPDVLYTAPDISPIHSPP